MDPDPDPSPNPPTSSDDPKYTTWKVVEDKELTWPDMEKHTWDNIDDIANEK